MFNKLSLSTPQTVIKNEIFFSKIIGTKFQSNCGTVSQKGTSAKIEKIELDIDFYVKFHEESIGVIAVCRNGTNTTLNERVSSSSFTKRYSFLVFFQNGTKILLGLIGIMSFNNLSIFS